MPSKSADSKAAARAEKKQLKAERKRIKKTSRDMSKRNSTAPDTLESRIAADDKSAKSRRRAERLARRKARDVYSLLGWKKMYVDGLCLVEDGLYSETVEFTDVSYQSARADRQDVIFNVLCALVNFFGPDTRVQYMVVNTPLPEAEIGRRQFVDVAADNPMYPYAEEYNLILNRKIQEGVSNIRRGLYITYSVEETDMSRAVQSLAHIRNQVVSSFGSIGSKAHKLSGQERLELIWSILHPGEEPDFDLVRDITLGNGLMTDKDLVAPTAIDFKPEEQTLVDGLLHPGADFTLDSGWWGQVLAIQSFGSELSDNAISSIVDLPLPMVVTWHIHGWDKSESIRKVRNADAWIDKEIMTEQQKNAKRGIDSSLVTPSLRHRKDETEEVLDQILNNNQRIYEYTGLVYVYARDRDKLLDAAMQVIRTARQSSLVVKKLPYRQKEGINSVLPLANNHVDLKRTLTTAQCAIQVPFATQELSDEGGIFMGQNKLSNNLVIENRKGLSSPMGFIAGKPGSGKSFIVKQEMAGIMMLTSRSRAASTCPACRRPLAGATEACPHCGEPLYSDQIFIIDPASEYSPLTNAFGGVYFEMAPDTSTYLNVFDRSDVGDMGSQSQLAFKVDALLAMMAATMGEGNEGLSEADKSIISRVVQLSYEQAGTMAEPTLGDFYEIMLRQPEPEARDVALRFERYVTGAMGFFNNQSNISLDKRIVNIGFLGLSESARAFGMISALEAVRNRMYHNFERGITTWIFIDEVQSMFSHPAIITYFSKFWAEGRKFGLIATGITQNSTRMLVHPDAATLIHNSDHIMLLKQSPVDREKWAQLLGLSAQEQSFIDESTPAGDGLLVSGGARVPIKGDFPKDTSLYDLFSTKASEVLERQRAERFASASTERPVQPIAGAADWDTPISGILASTEYGGAWADRLAAVGIERVADLRGKSRRELVSIDGIGPAAVRSLEGALVQAGFGKIIG